MEENKSKKTSTILIICLIIIGLVLLVVGKVAVDHLTNAIINSGDDSGEFVNTYDDNDWEERFDELEKKIDQQSSMFADVNITLGDIDTNAGTGKINFTVIPKEYSKNTKVTVTVGAYCTELKLKNNKFVGTMETPFNEVYDSAYVVMETDGKIKNEKIVLSDEEKSWNWDAIRYRVSGFADCSSELESNKYTLQISNAYVTVEAIEKCSNVPVLYITKNNQIVYQQDMKYRETAKEYQAECSKTFEIKEGDVFKCYAEYVGKSGLRYRIYWYSDSYEHSGENEEYPEDGSTIYDVNGNEIEFQYMDGESEE